MTLQNFFEDYYHASSVGDLDLLDNMFHKDSPFLLGIKAQYASLRKQLDIKVELQTLDLISKQDDLLVVRDCILFAGIKNGKTNQNRFENLHVLTKKQDGDWKLQITSGLKVLGA